jgi:hypothetical protein
MTSFFLRRSPFGSKRMGKDFHFATNLTHYPPPIFIGPFLFLLSGNFEVWRGLYWFTPSTMIWGIAMDQKQGIGNGIGAIITISHWIRMWYETVCISGNESSMEKG